MHTHRKESRTRLHYVLAVYCCLAVLAAPTSFGRTPEGVVPVSSEPNHKIRFDNGKVRMYEVFLHKGRGTLFHEHRADIFVVSFLDSEATDEPRGGTPLLFEVLPGTVGFVSTWAGPYSHRVIASKNTEFHVIAMELMSPKPDKAANPNQRANPPFRVVSENRRGRVYRIRLAPGESTGLYTRPASTALFAISTGRIAEEVDGKPNRLWDFEPGHFRWMDTSETLLLKNEGGKPVDLVEIEVF